MGAVPQRQVSVLLTEQGETRRDVGAEERQPEDHDLPEDGPSVEELLPDRGDLQGEEEAHLPVQRFHSEQTTGRDQEREQMIERTVREEPLEEKTINTEYLLTL